MKTKVTTRGVVVPRQMLDGAEEVELRKEGGKVLVIPLTEADPILRLGSDSVVCDAPEASQRHDRYLYGSRE